MTAGHQGWPSSQTGSLSLQGFQSVPFPGLGPNICQERSVNSYAWPGKFDSSFIHLLRVSLRLLSYPASPCRAAVNSHHAVYPERDRRLLFSRGCGYDSAVTASLLPPAAQHTGTGAESHHLTAAARKCTFPARRKHTMDTDMVEDHGLWTHILG